MYLRVVSLHCTTMTKRTTSQANPFHSINQDTRLRSHLRSKAHLLGSGQRDGTRLSSLEDAEHSVLREDTEEEAPAQRAGSLAVPAALCRRRLQGVEDGTAAGLCGVWTGQ